MFGQRRSAALRRRNVGARSHATTCSRRSVSSASSDIAIGMPSAERHVGQRALAKAMDREDRGFVEGLQRQIESCRPSLVVGAGRARAAQVCSSRSTKDRPPRAAPSPRSAASVSAMRARMRSRNSAVAALVKVTTRICCTVQLAFEQQPQVQAAERPGLAGAGRRLDQARAAQLAAVNVEGVRRHGGGLRVAQVLAQRVEDGFGQRLEGVVQRIVDTAQRQPVCRVGLFAEGPVSGRAPCGQRLATAVAASNSPGRAWIEVQRCAQALAVQTQQRDELRGGVGAGREVEARHRPTANVCTAQRRPGRWRTAPGGAARLRGNRPRGCRRSASPVDRWPQRGEAALQHPGLAVRRQFGSCGVRRERASAPASRTRSAKLSQVSQFALQFSSPMAPAGISVPACASASSGSASMPRSNCGSSRRGQRTARRCVGHERLVVDQFLGLARQRHAQAAAQQVARRVAEELDQLRQARPRATRLRARAAAARRTALPRSERVRCRRRTR